MKAIKTALILGFCTLFSLTGGPGLAGEDSLRRGQAALLDGRYLAALHLAGQAFASGYRPDAAALVMARAADLGGASFRRTEQLYLTALDKAENKAPVLGHLTLFYLQSGQITKAGRTEAAFTARCRYNCAGFTQQINAARQSR